MAINIDIFYTQNKLLKHKLKIKMNIKMQQGRMYMKTTEIALC